MTVVIHCEEILNRLKVVSQVHLFIFQMFKIITAIGLFHKVEARSLSPSLSMIAALLLAEEAKLAALLDVAFHFLVEEEGLVGPRK